MSPLAPMKPCLQPGCPTLHRNRRGRCDLHAAKHERERNRTTDANRPNTTERGYGQDWQEFRRQVLAANPYCTAPGCTRLAVDLHHINSVAEYPELRLVPANVQPMCHECHASHTSRTQGWGRRRG